jgi:outer membrane protein OmpA-like peptidoglycan-associated protein
MKRLILSALPILLIGCAQQSIKPIDKQSVQRSNEPSLITAIKNTRNIPDNMTIKEIHAHLLKKLTPLGLKVSLKGDKLWINMNSDVLFDINKTIIKGKSKFLLASLATELKTDTEHYLHIVGHTDSTGTDEHNLDLSVKRSLAVKKVLLDYGVPSYRVSGSGLGESSPIASNTSHFGRKSNRRVELFVYINNKPNVQ